MTESRPAAPAVQLSEGLAHPDGPADDGTGRLVGQGDEAAERRRAPAVAPARDEWRRVKAAGVAVGSAAILAAALYAGNRARKS